MEGISSANYIALNVTEDSDEDSVNSMDLVMSVVPREPNVPVDLDLTGEGPSAGQTEEVTFPTCEDGFSAALNEYLSKDPYNPDRMDHRLAVAIHEENIDEVRVILEAIPQYDLCSLFSKKISCIIGFSGSGVNNGGVSECEEVLVYSSLLCYALEKNSPGIIKLVLDKLKECGTQHDIVSEAETEKQLRNAIRFIHLNLLQKLNILLDQLDKEKVKTMLQTYVSVVPLYMLGDQKILVGKTLFGFALQHKNGVILEDITDIVSNDDALNPIKDAEEILEQQTAEIVKLYKAEKFEEIEKFILSLDLPLVKQILLRKVNISLAAEMMRTSFMSPGFIYQNQLNNIPNISNIISFCSFETFKIIWNNNLLKDFIRMNENMIFPLHFAAMNTCIHVLETLLDTCNIQLQNRDGDTPLHFASYFGMIENVALLLNRGANYEIIGSMKCSPFDAAFYGGNVQVYEIYFKMYKYHECCSFVNKNKKEILLLGILRKLIKLGKGMKEMNKRDNVYIESAEFDWEKLQKLELYHAMKENRYIGEKILNEKWLKLNLFKSCLTYRDKLTYLDTLEFILKNQLHPHRISCVLDEDDRWFIGHKSNWDLLTQLLRAGYQLNSRHLNGKSMLSGINTNLLRTVLDNHMERKIDCAADNRRKDMPGNEKFYLILENPFQHNKVGGDILNIQEINKSIKHVELALHPVLQALLSIKWQYMRKYIILKTCIFIPFLILINMYALENITKLENANNTTFEDDLDVGTNFSKYGKEEKIAYAQIWHVLNTFLFFQCIVGCATLSVLLKTFCQETKKIWNLRGGRKTLLREYYWNKFRWSDWQEYVLWIFVFSLLRNMISPTVVVLWSWCCFFSILSNYPYFLPFRYIFFSIMQSYAKFLIFASGLIGAYMMGFHMLLRNCLEDGEKCADGGFSSIYKTTLTIPAMMMGGIEYKSYVTDVASPYVSILFLSFVFVITFSLLNMMNGLAINITDELKSKALLYRTKGLCDMIFEYETFMDHILFFLKYLGFKDCELILKISKMKVNPFSGACEFIRVGKELILIKKFGRPIIENWIDKGFVLDKALIQEAFEIIDKRTKGNNTDIIKANQSSESTNSEEEIVCKYENLLKLIKQMSKDNSRLEDKVNYLQKSMLSKIEELQQLHVASQQEILNLLKV